MAHEEKEKKSEELDIEKERGEMGERDGRTGLVLNGNFGHG